MGDSDSDLGSATSSPERGANVEEGHRRSERIKEKLKETEIVTLTAELVDAINEQLKRYDATYNSIAKSSVAADYETFLSEIDSGFELISSMFKNIVTVSENKTDSTTEQIFSDYCKDIDSMKSSVNDSKQQASEDDEMELRLQRQMEETKKKLEHQMQLLRERRMRRDSKIPQDKRNGLSPPHQSEEDSDPTSATNSSEQVDSQPPAQEASNELPELVRPASVSNSQNNLEVINLLADSLALSMTKASAKRTSVQPSVFSGDIITFADWEVDMNAYLEAENINGKDRLRHLKMYVSDEAKKCINGHFITNSNESYLDARRDLKDRYGNKQNVTRTFRKQLADWPRINGKDGKALREYGDFLSHIRSAMKTIPDLRILNDSHENEKAMEKLPEWLRNRWARTVAKVERQEDRYPDFGEFTNFIKDEAYVMMLPISQPLHRARERSEHQDTNERGRMQQNFRERYQRPAAAKSFRTSTGEFKHSCLFCERDNHKTGDCFRLQAKPYPDRVAFVKERGICFGCLNTGHRSKQCKERLTCKKCGKLHPSALHDTERRNQEGKAYVPKGQETGSQEPKKGDGTESDTKADPKTSIQMESKVNVKTTQMKRCMVSMAVPVYISADNKQEMLVYALLDTQSDACFISKEVADHIKPRGVPEQINICTLNGNLKKTANRYSDITLRGYTTNSSTRISAYEQDAIPCDRQQIPTASIAKEMKHLQAIAEKLPPELDIPVGLLIGMDCPQALTPLNSIPGEAGQTFAIETIFGWTLCGGAKPMMNQQKMSYKIDTKKDTEMLKILEKDFQLAEQDDEKMSQDDLQFLKMLEVGTVQGEDGTYTLPLPFRKIPQLRNNRPQAMSRLEQLLKKFRKDSSLKEEYFKFMDNLITKGHAEAVPDTAESKPGQVWYIPHFGVRHPKKKKLRVVFDASARSDGQSLNDMLLPGPDHINSLIGILTRFRREQIAICCDIEQMFYNFKVLPQHRDYLRFLWIDKDTTETREYRMSVHLFGATSSPGVATYALRRIAANYSMISREASTFLTKDFYVDDGITSVGTTQEAVQLIQEARAICDKANVRLHKFMTNDRATLASVPESERSDKVQNIDLLKDKLPNDCTLGLEWRPDSETLNFTTKLEAKPATKRGLLSTIAQVYDPLGFVAPFVLSGKKILQTCTTMIKDWDEPISEDLLAEWESWYSDLKELEKVKINRCVKPGWMEKIARQELHHFSDASLTGYGACSYIRFINSDGKAHSELLLGKSRVSPINKPSTIPRLELQAAVLATRLSNLLRKELHVHVDAEYFWTDSEIVLGYIANESSRYYMFVTNRVKEIKDVTKVEQWNYVRTNDNPADIASRGSSINDLINSTWFHGPRFLQEADLSAYTNHFLADKTLRKDDPEVRPVKTMATETSPDSGLVDRFTKFSSWNSLTKSFARLRKMAKEKTWKTTSLEPSDITEAEAFVIRALQREFYALEVKELIKTQAVKKTSTIVKLNPFLDRDGLIRVGGRSQKANDLQYAEKHPILIPKTAPPARLIVCYFYNKVHHLVQRSTLAAVREGGYWIVNAPALVKSVISSCMTCARLRRPPEVQQMGELPAERVENTPPFTHVGMDVFGPFYVKDRRTELKRWGLILTCLYSRAVHIELLDDLSTDAFISALRCFIAIRGAVKTLHSDQGTNFVGARNMLEKEIARVTDEQLKAYLLENRIEFKMHVPDASHQGGSWERQIRSIRAVLNGMSTKYRNRMNTQTLRTAFHEAASVVNSRPLTSTTITDPEQSLITPNRLLTAKSIQSSAPPPGEFEDEEIYGRAQWRIAQRWAQEFWTTWKAEYLTHLTQRQKWTQKQKNIKVGDLVLLKENQLPRNEWKTGIVEETTMGEDQLVRNVTLRIGNRHLDSKGKPMYSPAILKRPVQKLILLLRA